MKELIFGKDNTKEIVSIEIENDEVVIYLLNGESYTKPMVYWMLASKPLDSKFDKLFGNQHYKYIKRFSKSKDYYANLKKYKDKDVFVVYDLIESAMIYYGLTLFKGLEVKDVPVLSFDIEANGLALDNESKVFLITNTFRDIDGSIEKKHFRVDHYNNDDVKMIEDWCKWVCSIDPIVITGHNIFGYDLPYIQHCYYRETKKNLPLGINEQPVTIGKRESRFRVDANNDWNFKKIYIKGRHIIDGMFLAVKYDIGRNYPSWGLKQIAEYEGFVKEDRQFYDASKIGKNWHIKEEREKIVAYGLDDSDDSLAIYDLMIPSLFYMANSVPKTFQTICYSASGAKLNSILVRAYLQNEKSIPKASDNEYVAGGMSYGVPGIYSNVVKFDAKSYYPSTILTFDIYDEKKDPEAYFLKMVEYFTHKRFEQKDLFKKTREKKYDDLQAASKIFINSAYGMLGTPGLNFNSPKNAKLITRNCRTGLQKAVIWATGKDIGYWWSDYLESRTATQDIEVTSCDFKTEVSFENMPRHDWKLVNIDTDALSFCKADESPFAEKEYEEAINELNSIMYSEWEDDGQFDRFLVVKAKNYVMKEKGSDKYKYKGSSILDSKKEPALVELLHKLIEDLIETDGKHLEIIYKGFVKEVLEIKDISRWATKKNITKKVLSPERANEQNVLNAIQHLNPREGDKFYLYTALNGQIPEVKNKTSNAFCVLRKGSEPKLVDNDILKNIDDWKNDHYIPHYLGRIYNTLKILETVIDISKFLNYKNKGNRKYLEII